MIQIENIYLFPLLHIYAPDINMHHSTYVLRITKNFQIFDIKTITGIYLKNSCQDTLVECIIWKVRFIILIVK